MKKFLAVALFLAFVASDAFAVSVFRLTDGAYSHSGGTGAFVFTNPAGPAGNYAEMERYNLLSFSEGNVTMTFDESTGFVRVQGTAPIKRSTNVGASAFANTFVSASGNYSLDASFFVTQNSTPQNGLPQYLLMTTGVESLTIRNPLGQEAKLPIVGAYPGGPGFSFGFSIVGNSLNGAFWSYGSIAGGDGNFNGNSVPEPMTLGLLSMGLLAGGARLRKRA